MSNFTNLPEADGGQDDSLVVEVGFQKMPISIKTYQAIYHQLTGKFQRIEKDYNHPFRIEMEDILQLHKKIMQVSSSHNVITNRHEAVVYHTDETKSELNSISQYDKSINKPILSILLTYQFIIIPMNVQTEFKKPQPYKISIQFRSGISIKEKIEHLRKEAINGMFVFIDDESAKLSIEYVDYLIALNFKNIIDDCILGFKKVQRSKYINFATKNIGKIKSFFKYTPLFSFFLISLFLSDYFIKNNLLELFKYSFVVSFGLFFIYIVSDYLSRKVNVSLYDLKNFSQIELNRGDTNLIKKNETDCRSSFLKIACNFLVNLLIAVLSTVICSFLAFK